MFGKHQVFNSCGFAAAAAAIAVGAVVSLSTPAIAMASYLGFKDIPSSHWAVESKVIDYAVGRGIFLGYGSDAWGPDDPVARGQVATVIYRICAPEDEVFLPTVIYDPYRPFYTTTPTDGKVEGKYYEKAMVWAYHYGIVTGSGTYVYGEILPDHTTIRHDFVVDEPWEVAKKRWPHFSEPNVRPDDPISREELAVMLQRMAEHRGTYDSASADYSELDSRPDGNAVSKWARDAVAWAIGEGIMEGDGTGRLNPQGTTTRAEASKMFEIAIEGKGFAIEGRERVEVKSSLYSKESFWECMNCGEQSYEGENSIVHLPYCPENNGGHAWVVSTSDELHWIHLSELDGARADRLRSELESYGLLVSWYEWR